jgi:hypothetical protein
MDNDAQAVLAAAKSMFNLTPGMGLGTTANNPNDALEAARRRKAAKGLSAEERMKTLTDAGVTDRAGMGAVFQRLYAQPTRAFMLARGGK